MGTDSRVARVLRMKPDRIAAAWRRVRLAEAKPPRLLNLLDGCVEPFIAEIGASLCGADGNPWSRTRGVLRISPERGPGGLYEEFGLLRRCLNDAVAALGGTLDERRQISEAVDQAVDSAVTIAKRFAEPNTADPLIPFGGLVVEIFERPSVLAPAEAEAAAVH